MLLSNTVDITLQNAAYGGDTVGRLPDGRAVFVPFAVPGESVRIKIVLDKKKFARGELVEVLEPASSRVEARCPHFTICGGCHYQHISYDEQLHLKKIILQDQLERIGRLVSPPVVDVVPSPHQFNYRSQVRFQLSHRGKPGFVPFNKQGILEIEQCHLPEIPLSEIWPSLEIDPEAGLTALGLRHGAQENILVTLESEYLFDAEFDIESLPVSVVHISPDHTEVLAGSEYTFMQVNGRQFRVSAGSFFQVNTPLAGQMVSAVESALPDQPGLVLELYSGVGLFSAFIAPRAEKLVAIEASESAADDFVHNLDEFDHVELYQGSVEEIFPDLVIKPHVVVADPPRTGLHKKVISELIALKPDHFIYISCDPATLARDSQLLVEGGFSPLRFIPFDFFPQTYHIETLSIWSR